MAQIIIEIPDAVAVRVLNAVCETFGYDSSSGETKAAFSKKVVVRWLKDVVVNHEARSASKSAFDQASERAKTELNIT